MEGEGDVSGWSRMMRSREQSLKPPRQKEQSVQRSWGTHKPGVLTGASEGEGRRQLLDPVGTPCSQGKRCGFSKRGEPRGISAGEQPLSSPLLSGFFSPLKGPSARCAEARWGWGGRPVGAVSSRSSPRGEGPGGWG